jgi:cytoskeletal protein CcmA (bactofilin family)
MKKLALLIALLLVACPAQTPAQDAPKPIDVTGVWESTVESPQGSLTSTATYKQNGEELTGTHVGQLGELQLKGTVKGKAIAYTITVDMGGQQLTITYSGTVDGDTITGTAEFGGMGSGNWTVKRKK